MEVRTARKDLTAVTFPADDAVFAERVAELLDDIRHDQPLHEVARHVEDALRVIHPRIATSFRDTLAGFGDCVMYVFRDGGARSQVSNDGWIRDDSTARVVTDTTGRYIDANEAAEELFGVSRETIVGSHAGAFTRPDVRIEDEGALWRALARDGRLHSLALVTCRDGSEVSVEFVTIRDVDGPGRHVTYLRAVG